MTVRRLVNDPDAFRMACIIGGHMLVTSVSSDETEFRVNDVILSINGKSEWESACN